MCDCRQAGAIQVHNYVNSLDIVPRLLGDTRLNAILNILSAVLPARYQKLVQAFEAVIQHAAAYIPYGCYHLLLGSNMTTVSAFGNPKVLLLTLAHIWDPLMQVIPLKYRQTVHKIVKPVMCIWRSQPLARS